MPVGYDHVLFCTGKLITGFNERMTKDEAKARARVWMESCGDIPTDLWSSATVDLLRSWKRDDHYGRVPEPSDFRAAVHDRLQRRAIELQRAKAMLAKANEPTVRKEDAPIRESNVARLKRVLREQQDADVPEADRLFNMANTERALAFAEKRPMEHWAQQFFDDRVAKEGGRARESIGHQAGIVASRNSPTNRRLAELAAAKRQGRPPKPWTAGQPVYEKPSIEEPPMPDDVPEVA